MLVCRFISISSSYLTSSAEVSTMSSSITQIEERATHLASHQYDSAITLGVTQIGQGNYI